MAIEFHTIPEECHAQIFFVDGGYTVEDWEAEIEATGEVICFNTWDFAGQRRQTSLYNRRFESGRR